MNKYSRGIKQKRRIDNSKFGDRTGKEGLVIGVQKGLENLLVTFLVRRVLYCFLGASRICALFVIQLPNLGKYLLVF